MRKFFVIAVVVCFNLSLAYPQARFVDHEFEDYYEWFHNQSQTANLYTDGAELITFAETKVKTAACQESETITRLPMGLKLINMLDDEQELTEDEINGYNDIWFHVSGADIHGNYFEGFIWGANIAKSWQFSDMTGDGVLELVMLGIASKKRKRIKDINAEIKVIKSGKLLTKKTVPGLCVFEECASSALVRILKDQPCKGALIVEVSTMTIGCTAGIEKAYYFQTPSGDLERVYHAELTTQKQYRNKSFEFVDETGITTLCRFSHEDENFNPVWETKKVKSDSNNIVRTTSKKARA